MRRICFIPFFILISLSVSKQSYSQEKVNNVIVFLALDVNLPAYHTLMEGFNGLYSEVSDQPINVIAEYMGINRYPHEEDIESVIGQYCEKYEALDIDLLITFGTGTFSLLKEYGFDSISTSPVINIDI